MQGAQERLHAARRNLEEDLPFAAVGLAYYAMLLRRPRRAERGGSLRKDALRVVDPLQRRLRTDFPLSR